VKDAISLPIGIARPRPAIFQARETIALAARFLAAHWLLLGVLAATFGIHAPGLTAYFIGDDFVVFGDIATRSFPRFVADVVTLHDTTPNWRPLTSMVYYGEYHLFGLNAVGWRLTHLLVHMGSVVLLYWLATLLTKRTSAGTVAALAFGISGAHYDTVNYVTAFPHVLGNALVLASLVCVVLAASRRAGAWALVASILLFGLAVSADEGRFVFAPLPPFVWALYRLRRPRDLPSALVFAAPFAAIAGAWATFYFLSDSPQLNFGNYNWSAGALSRLWLYLSWLVYPWGKLLVEPDRLRLALGITLLVLAGLFLLVGPHGARLGALGMALALLPYLPVDLWTAARYTYGAAAFFALLLGTIAGTVFDWARPRLWVFRPLAPPLAMAALAAAGVFWGWQTLSRDAVTNDSTEDWRLLGNEIQARVPAPPPGTTIYVIEGPWRNPIYQVAWVPSVARTFYGNGVTMYDLNSWDFALRPEPRPQWPVLLYFNGHLWPIDPRHRPPSPAATTRSALLIP